MMHDVKFDATRVADMEERMGLKISVTGPKRVDMKIAPACPACGRKVEIKLRDAAPGTVVRCACGAGIKLTGDDMRRAQAALDKLIDKLHRFGR